MSIPFAANLLNCFDRQIPAAIAEDLRQEWHLTDTASGWLGTAFILTYAFPGIPLGRQADKHSRKWILAAGLGVWSIRTGFSGVCRGYGCFFLIRLEVA